MADTGSEVAETTTRDARDSLERLLERRFLWTRERAAGGHAPYPWATRGDESLPGPAAYVPSDGARDVAEALGRRGATSEVRAREAGGVDVLLRRGGEGPVHDVPEGPAPETGGAPSQEPAGAGDQAVATEASTLTFANHPDQPSLDELHARAYAAGMRGLGIDAEYRLVAEGGEARHLVAVAYPASERDRFLDASMVCLHDAGALADMAREDPYARDAALLEATRARLRARETDRSRGDAPERPDRLPQDRPMDAEAYLALGARERARIAPEMIPADAFGREGLEQSAAAHRAAATSLMRVRERERTRAHAPSDVRERGSR